MGVWNKLFSVKREFSLPINWDMHNHVLFGIDDGAKTIEESVEMAKLYVDAGFKKVTCTPHILMDFYPNSRDTIIPVLHVLTQELQRQEIDLELAYAAEYYIDDAFVSKLENQEKLLTFMDNHVLVETGFMNKPWNLHDVFFRLQSEGYQVVLAHPERYTYLQSDYDIAEEMFAAGIKFQINLLSFIGYYSPNAKKTAEWLIEKGYYHFVATDAHTPRQLAKLSEVRSQKILDKIDWSKVENRL